MFDCILQCIFDWQHLDEYVINQADIVKLAKLRVTAATKKLERTKNKRTAQVAGLDEQEQIKTSNSQKPSAHIFSELSQNGPILHHFPNKATPVGLIACQDGLPRSPLLIPPRLLNVSRGSVSQSNGGSRTALDVSTAPLFSERRALVNHLGQGGFQSSLPSLYERPRPQADVYQVHQVDTHPGSITSKHSSSSHNMAVYQSSQQHNLSVGHSLNLQRSSPFQLSSSYPSLSLPSAQAFGPYEPYINSLQHSADQYRSTSNPSSCSYLTSPLLHTGLNFSSQNFMNLPIRPNFEYRDAHCYGIHPRFSNGNVSSIRGLHEQDAGALNHDSELHRKAFK